MSVDMLPKNMNTGCSDFKIVLLSLWRWPRNTVAFANTHGRCKYAKLRHPVSPMHLLHLVMARNRFAKSINMVQCGSHLWWKGLCRRDRKECQGNIHQQYASRKSQHDISTHTANEGAPDRSLCCKNGGGLRRPPKKRRDVQSSPPCIQWMKPMPTIARYEQRIDIVAGANCFVDCWKTWMKQACKLILICSGRHACYW